ncbi:uncharacterized protein LOC133509052 [Syngnathoides biaculeatus]|uniref:uncharacterized protein LOC133509052 n=1 Tax=Syngnathoides biaculeatus TaxID=300417 RepID=UPI002ADE51B2|nr:uncharacterized protein LOC133509052 [Syngnathoides biaculeatus]
MENGPTGKNVIPRDGWLTYRLPTTFIRFTEHLLQAAACVVFGGWYIEKVHGSGFLDVSPSATLNAKLTPPRRPVQKSRRKTPTKRSSQKCWKTIVKGDGPRRPSLATLHTSSDGPAGGVLCILIGGAEEQGHKCVLGRTSGGDTLHMLSTAKRWIFIKPGTLPGEGWQFDCTYQDKMERVQVSSRRSVSNLKCTCQIWLV